ncbi:MAG: alcohol dehydrogenase catalytic domain-containing protein [Synergistaceae bacterium]|jgi:propanol-preferring alcohol dehydrogenase|nr:alcohol dehydrogenase catalytic domain-containing protein [Synergistaceae bacterium]
MKAAVLREFHRPLSLEEREIPSPGDGEVLVKVRASGLCVSDLHIQDGMIASTPLPHVPGHETAGEVAALGENVRNFSVGDHVIVGIDVTCGECRFCRTGRGNLCKNLKRTGFELDGGHAEYVTARREQLFKIDHAVPFAEACIIPDAVACMYHAIKAQAGVRAGDRALILGAGGLGMQGIRILKYFGAETWCTSRQKAKLDLARSLGADHALDSTAATLVAEIERMTDGEMCDVVFDNIGIASSVQTSLGLIRPGGKVVVVGYNDPAFTVGYQDLVIREKEVIGIRGSTRQEIAEVVRLAERGKIKPFVWRTIPFEEINEGLNALRKGESMGRTVVMFD